MTERPQINCPTKCGGAMPPHFCVCRICWSEVPWPLKVTWWDASSRKDDADLAETRAQILNHLRLHGSAIR